MTEQPELAAIHNEFSQKLWELWKEVREGKDIDAVKFSRLTLITLTHVAAVLAVDSHMPLDQFLQVCTATFNEAYEAAPKFG